ncbi:MAG: hypothetical protein ACRDD2_08745 [Sarcina sp.]
MKRFLVIVEGAHDIAFLGKLLKTLDYKEIRNIKDIDLLLQKLIPKNFPFVDDKLSIFNFVPFFYKKEDKQIVILNANGEQNILKK